MPAVARPTGSEGLGRLSPLDARGFNATPPSDAMGREERLLNGFRILVSPRGVVGLAIRLEPARRGAIVSRTNAAMAGSDASTAHPPRVGPMKGKRTGGFRASSTVV